MEMLILLCLATDPICTKDNALQTIRVPLEQISSNCMFVAETYIVQNDIVIDGMKVNARCRI